MSNLDPCPAADFTAGNQGATDLDALSIIFLLGQPRKISCHG